MPTSDIIWLCYLIGCFLMMLHVVRHQRYLHPRGIAADLGRIVAIFTWPLAVLYGLWIGLSWRKHRH